MPSPHHPTPVNIWQQKINSPYIISHNLLTKIFFFTDMQFSVILSCILLPLVKSQIFENDLPVSLQPPPPQPQPKADFGSLILSGLPVASIPQIPSAPSGPFPPKPISHRAVLFSAEEEAKLPPSLLNPFYKNPRIAEQLAKQSWFEPGENLVEDRDTEKIPRDKIFYALKSAGLIRRRRYALH